MDSKKLIPDGKEIIICNIGKFAEDFLYIFDWIRPAGYIDDSFTEEAYKGLPVKRTADMALDKYAGKVYIIVCDLKAHESGAGVREWQLLEQAGFELGRDMVFAEELFGTLDFDWRDCVKGRKIAFWGTGAIMRNFYMRSLSEKTGLMPDIFIDSDPSKSGKMMYGAKVVTPDGAGDLGKYFIIVMTNDYYHEVYGYLSGKGLRETEDFISYRLVFDKTHIDPSEMLRKTVYAKPLKNQTFCQIPFQLAYLRLDGNTVFCVCPEYVRVNEACTGNYFYLPYGKVWNSFEAKIFRLSILNKTYCFCLENSCFIMNPRREEDESAQRWDAPLVRETPPEVIIELDDACNLSCPSCRMRAKHNEGGKEQRRKMALAAKLKETNWLDRADWIWMSGHGEVFYSKVYRSLLYHDREEKRGGYHDPVQWRSVYGRRVCAYPRML